MTGGQVSYAQKSQKDSVAAARKAQEKAKEAAAKQREKEQAEKQKALQASRDSMAKARAKETAQRQAAQKRTTDSIAKIRKHKTDSLAAIRKYRESKKYKDSVEKAKAVKLKTLQAARVAKVDSAKAARKKITDSTIAVRKVKTDSARAVVKKRTDSLTAKRKYRESKRYADSVAVVKKMKTDSLMAKRKAFSDSLKAHRKKVTDSFAKVRKGKTDAIAAARKKKTDSLLAIKKVRTDSLAKVKEKKEKAQKAKEKEREQKQQLAFELKIKKKQKAYTNEKMLKRRWSVPRQIVQNTFTHYNYFFNADKKMDEALANMLRTKKDNYDSLLALFPFNPDRDSSLLSSDMDSIIYKASMGIQIHDPRTKWGDDLYLLLGQAYFYKGNYNEASASFRYILSLRDKRKKKPNQSESLYTKKSGKGLSIAQEEKKGMLSFLQHRSVHNESLLWLSRTYTQMKQEGNAESVIDLLETDPNFPKDLQGRLALEKSFIYLNQKDYKAAATQLNIVADDNNMPNWMRMRSAFIAGQISQSRGEYTASAASFRKVIDLNPKVDMDFYARKNLAYSMMYAGGAQEESIASLKKVLNDGKYQPYYEQVYYILGRLSANSGNNAEAINYLNEGIRSPKSTPKQKGLSFATLGGVYYKLGEYEAAKNAYDSASAFASYMPGDSLIELAVKRSAALVSITGPLKTIREQDSLLALGSMSEKEMRAEVRRYIRKLEQQRADSIFKSEQVTTTGTGANSTGGGNTPYANWYFNNTALVQQGVNEFKRKWGNRQPVDNWRRSAAAGNMNNNSSTQNNNSNAGEGQAIEVDENGIPTEEALVALIPRDESAKGEARMLIRRAYMDASNAYIKDLEDYPPATKLMDTLGVRYPTHEYKDEVLYLRYLIYIRQNKVADARRYADELLQQYPDSKYAPLVKPRESAVNNNPGDISEGAFYEETYGLVLDHKYAWALDKVKQARVNYPGGKYAKRFTIVEGISLAGMAAYKPADSLIKGFITEYPKDSLRPWADAILKYIQLNMPKDTAVGKVDTSKATGASPMSGGPSATQAKPLPNAGGGFPPDVDPAPKPAVKSIPAFIYRPEDEHMVLFVFGGMDSRASGFRAGVTDFNTFKFNNLGLSTDIQVLSPESGIVVIKTFRNLSAAKIYMNSLRSTGQLYREYKPGEYQLIYISAMNLEKLTIDKDMKAYLQFYNTSYK
jgi:tetratricopeptide (TPR) repeat protein